LSTVVSHHQHAGCQMKPTLAAVLCAWLSIGASEAKDLSSLAPDARPIGTWAYHTHKGSFALNLHDKGACLIMATPSPEGGALELPCIWTISDNFITLNPAGYRFETRSLVPIGGTSVRLRYLPDEDAMQLLGGSEAWLQRVE